jgi:tetratricopeptide (TPR) repeat protein
MMLMLETNYASLLVDLGELRQAEALCQRVLAVAEAREDLVRQADGLRCRARLLGARYRLKDARADLERALELAERTEDSLLVAQVLADLGGVHGRLGAADAATFAWRRALELFVRIGAALQAQAVSALLDRPPTAPRLVVA